VRADDINASLNYNDSLRATYKNDNISCNISCTPLDKNESMLIPPDIRQCKRSFRSKNTNISKVDYLSPTNLNIGKKFILKN